MSFSQSDRLQVRLFKAVEKTVALAFDRPYLARLHLEIDARQVLGGNTNVGEDVDVTSVLRGGNSVEARVTLIAKRTKCNLGQIVLEDVLPRRVIPWAPRGVPEHMRAEPSGDVDGAVEKCLSAEDFGRSVDADFQPEVQVPPRR